MRVSGDTGYCSQQGSKEEKRNLVLVGLECEQEVVCREVNSGWWGHEGIRVLASSPNTAQPRDLAQVPAPLAGPQCPLP